MTPQDPQLTEAAVCFLIACAILSIVAQDGKMAFKKIDNSTRGLMLRQAMV